MAKPEQKTSTTNSVFWISALVVLVGAVFSIRAMTREAIRVMVAPVSYQTLSSQVSTNGKVEPVEPFQAHAPAPGVVQRIYVDEGAHVAAGQLLVKMDDVDAKSRLASAESSLAQAQLQLSDLQHGGSNEERNSFSNNISTAKLEQQSAETNLKALQLLQQKGSASANEVASAEQRLRSANLALSNASSHASGRYGADDIASAKARVEEAKASVAAAQDAITATDIHSPYSGTVYSIPVSEYDFVQAGEDLMDVADLTRLQVRAYFDEPEIGKLKDGQPVTIVWAAKPNQVWHGHIEHTPTTIIAYGTRNVGECLITVDDAKGDLAPNSNVTVTVTEAQRSHVLSVPREALHTDGARNYVYTIAEGKLRQTPVQLGALVTLTDVEIAGGLQPNDIVVLGPVNPSKELAPGMAVKPVR